MLQTALSYALLPRNNKRFSNFMLVLAQTSILLIFFKLIFF